MIAAVFNAVDDRIGSHDTGAAWRMQVEDVTGLVPALQAALDTGRKVLVTADHGHTPFRGTALRVGNGSTPRYVRLKPGEDVPDGFVEIDCGDLAGEPGRTAFAWRSGVYRGQVQVGFHGGCSLEARHRTERRSELPRRIPSITEAPLLVRRWTGFSPGS